MYAAIIPNTDTIEQLAGPFQSPALLRWVPSLRRLERLELWVGRALMGKDVQQAMYDHCPQLNNVSIYSWPDPSSLGQVPIDPFEADKELGSFLHGLPENSLESFENIRQCGISQSICSGLARHAPSLTDLRLCVEKEAIPHLLLLKDCVNLQRVKFEVAGVNLDENSIKQEELTGLTAWLRDCHRLQSLEFFEAAFAPTVLTPVLQSNDIRLEELSIRSLRSWYAMKNHRSFHQALANQKALNTLSLFGDAAEVIHDDNSALVDSVRQCKQLKHLKLRGVSEYLNETAISELLVALPQLEELYIQGLNLGDEILDYVAVHPELRSICFMDLTSFSFEGLLSFVGKLDTSKRNFDLAIQMASNEALLSDEEVQVIRQALFDKVGGKLDYVPFRDADASEFEGESD